MEMRQLESLVAIADGGSFSRAAVMLNLAQPSLLERELGQRLLVRTGRGVALTAGTRLTRETTALLRELDFRTELPSER